MFKVLIYVRETNKKDCKYGLIIVGNAKLLSRQQLWNHLLVYYKEKRLLVEGALANLKESNVQFSKPRALVNTTNPGGRFMSTAMFSAREAIVPGSVYDRSRQMNGGLPPYRGSGFRGIHDSMSFIMSNDRMRPTAAIPVPLNMFLPQPPPVPAYYGQQPHLAGGSGSQQKGKWSTGKKGRSDLDYLNSQASQDLYFNSNFSQGFSQGALTQGGLSMSQAFPGMSQPGLSQQELSQDAYIDENLRSQIDAMMLSQETSMPLAQQPGGGQPHHDIHFYPASQY